MQTKPKKLITILVVDDQPTNLFLLTTILKAAGFGIATALDAFAALQVAELSPPDLVLMDVMMPGMDGVEACRRLKEKEFTRHIPVLFITGQNDPNGSLEAFKAGGADYILKPFKVEDVLARINAHLLIHHLNCELRFRNKTLEHKLASQEPVADPFHTAGQQIALVSERDFSGNIPRFVGKSMASRKILQDIHRLQNYRNTNVLITGESGTGKELIARAIHFGGPRPNTPFLPVNCSSIPAELAESTLFGHVRGAFTGAIADRKGCFELAHGGTLFLDEIGDMPPVIQAKLLRVLEDGRITPVGASQSRTVVVRILSATNKDLNDLINKGTFREDLFYRLAGFTLCSTPLRQRTDDIPILTEHMVELLSREMGIKKPTVHPDAMDCLLKHTFPGNIRELRNIMTRAIIESDSGEIHPEHLFLGVRDFSPISPSGGKRSSNEANSYLLRLSEGDESFWDLIQEPYLDRVLNRDQVRIIIGLGLRKSGGSFKDLVKLFRMPSSQYQRFMDFLRHNRLKPENTDWNKLEH